jgi:hypothetical protein
MTLGGTARIASCMQWTRSIELDMRYIAVLVPRWAPHTSTTSIQPDKAACLQPVHHVSRPRAISAAARTLSHPSRWQPRPFPRPPTLALSACANVT